MNIKFNNMIIHGFMSFGDAEINLSNNGFILISGKNNNPVDNASSNGSGKSSIFEAISWCLTGDTIRGAKNIVNSKLNDYAQVELTFDIDGNSYKIIRTLDIKKKSGLQFFINGEDKSGKGIKDTKQLLTEYLPDINSSLLGSVIIMGQGLPQRFTNNTPSGRKDVLESLSKSDFMINDLKQRVGKRKEILMGELNKFTIELNQCMGRRSILDRQLADYKNKLDELNKTDLSDLSGKKKQLEADIQINRINLDELNKQYNDIQQQMEKHNKISIDINSKYYSDKTNIDNKYADIVGDKIKRKTELQAKYTWLSNEIHKLESISDTCPTCKQKIPDVHKIDTTQNRQELRSIQIEIKIIDDELQPLQIQYNNEINDLNSAYSKAVFENDKKLADYKKGYMSTGESIKHTSNIITELNTELSDISVKIDRHELNKQLTEQEIEKISKNLVDIDSAILYNNNELDNINKHIDVIKKFDNILSRTFRGVLLTGIIDYISKRAKEYCSDIFKTDKIEFSLNGNDLNISYDGKMYEDLSGGEKQKVDLIIQFSLRDMLCKYLDFSCNILVLDEITDNLDLVGCDRIIDMITTKLIDIESVYIISHRSSDLSIPYDSELTVVKNEQGISSIE